MKILCVSQRFYPAIGGAERMIEEIADYMSSRHDITVLTTNTINLNGFWNSDQNNIVHQTRNLKKYSIIRCDVTTPSIVTDELKDFPFAINVPGPFSIKMWKYLFSETKNFDLIIGSAFPYNHLIPTLLASKKFNKPAICIPHIHLEFPEHYMTGFRLSLLDNFDVITVNTNYEKSQLIKYKIQEEKISIIPPSINTRLWQNLPNIDLCEKFNTPHDSVFILYIGHKSTEKGIFFLIESMKSLWQKNMKIELITVGLETSEFQSYLKSQNQKIQKHIHNFSVIDENFKKSLIASCDIFTLPSHSESFGIVYLEAWMCQKPVIGCNIDAVSELITDNSDGLLVEFGNKKQLSNKLEYLIHDPQLRTKLGKNGYEKVCKKYDSSQNYLLFENICLELLG